MNVRWLVVINPRDEPFSGVAVLHADYRTRTIAPVIVADPEGKTVLSRLVNETLGEPDIDGEGKRRWAFDLEFFCDCGPNSTVVYSARFGSDNASLASDDSWENRHATSVPLSASESEYNPEL
ncbi:hypothetical protein [Armatimonas sp.]|uniref:hypothetical protein n=1 Tax=Armatimonas sp. TaxID=1872638 RepID=UPI00374C8E05